MSDEKSPAARVSYKPSGNWAIEEILTLRNPGLPIMQGIYNLGRAFEPDAPPPETLLAVEADRQSLLALSAEQINETLREEREKYERSQFYNFAINARETAHWASLDGWKREEAVALLLGRDPARVSWSTIKSRLEQSAFVQLYRRVLQMVERAATLQTGEFVDPVGVLSWGLAAGLKPPALLIDLVEKRTGRGVRATSKPANPPAPTAAPASVHTTKALRRDVVTPAIELAQAECSDPFDVAAVWARLQVMAERKEPPLIGSTEEGIQYLDQGEAAILNRKALAKRLARAKRRA